MTVTIGHRTIHIIDIEVAVGKKEEKVYWRVQGYESRAASKEFPFVAVALE